ncbi:Ribonuclease [Nesidiocoris tenuis]|uniref:Ribonuclease n=1 Tax=Nesidiocoris tenuis TaxID=355587 RepID=A0ABN7BAD0_9HEMI|nr:Ribonuclease [Nesidiocoris tenuis]
MAVCCWLRAVGFLEDLPVAHHDYTDVSKFQKDLEHSYSIAARNCWVAAALYVLTFLVSGYLYYKNTRATLKINQR